ncbi:MAG: helix-turn-helix domain-containing protein [Proteobacteria bacterium]|nr:helix-turn-helix domain-containing protein [Pseudomonadota bacterium]
MNEKDFASLMQGVKEMTAHMRGEDVPGVKVTTIPDPDVHAIREAVSVTQKELAALLGVSRRTVENWEQRRTRPTGPARALLRIFQHDPQAAVKALQE